MAVENTMQTIMTDQLARQTALDVTQSFIVQAPAGSGKTELLVQRFLALLAVAESPEALVAITFTRKAAHEMRQRVMQALMSAQEEAPQKAHHYQTWQLASAALQQDQQRDWQLLENPNRLGISTIDAFCAAISRRAPLLSGLGICSPLLPKDMDAYYLEAARRLLAMLEEKSSPIAQSLACLLLHLDNQVERVEKLLIRLLADRDQWLPHLIIHGESLGASTFRALLENNLAHVVLDILAQCNQAIDLNISGELMALLRFSAENLGHPLANTAVFLTPTLEDLPHWRHLANFLITQDGNWRLSVDKRQGFPADQKVMKKRVMNFLEKMQTRSDLKTHFVALLTAPPIQYDETQWQFLAALSELLPLLVAELKVIFKERGGSDFSEVTIAALTALEDQGSPTELTFALDAQINHFLIDEFQDTSTTQFHLLERLTANWDPQDGRTLFLVGDPMQSIYRFRAAEVGLFLKAQQEGIGVVKLNSLTLSENFRSSPTLVTWMNNTFTHIFPEQSDMSMGAVHFSPCTAAKAADAESGVFIHAFSPNPTDEMTPNALVNQVIQTILQAQSQDPNQSIAILVRARSHLTAIIPILKKENISFSAVEIESLHQQMIVQDLLSLTGALLHLGDRLSWLSILRAPWCGLTLHDLHAVATQDLHATIWGNIQDLVHFILNAQSNPLSKSGQQALSQIALVFEFALTQRGRLSLRAWIEQTWQALKGPTFLSDVAQWSAAMAYFKLLDTFDSAGEMPDIHQLTKLMAREYASTSAQPDAQLQIMTIHKAKGLEFDTVIIPYLELKSQPDQEELLLWLDRPRPEKDSDLILAPIKARHQKQDDIYVWLQGIFKKKNDYERTRLLYVAATRAKKNLHLMANVSLKETESSALKTDATHLKKRNTSSFLGLLWDCFEMANGVNVERE